MDKKSRRGAPETRLGTGALIRQSGSLAPRRIVLVFVDGEKTEFQYFRGWQRVLGPYGFALIPRWVSSGGNAYVAVSETKRLLARDTEFDEVWCVCDVDDTSDKDLGRAIALAASSSINLALSRRCFEVWLALHWDKISLSPLVSEGEAVALVKGFCESYDARNKIVPFGMLYPLTDSACANAHWLERQGITNPATTVHRLVSQLREAERRNAGAERS